MGITKAINQREFDIGHSASSRHLNILETLYDYIKNLGSITQDCLFIDLRSNIISQIFSKIYWKTMIPVLHFRNSL